MSASNCFIAPKLKVGFQNRPDTFTGQLAYIIYYDAQGKLRKEKSWTGWCDKSIPSVEFDNKPMTGFIINKGVQRSSEWFGTGRTMVRIHDPRGFEFEITHDNLIQLLMHSDVSKRDIVQECIYAWFGTELVLLPTNSSEYQTSLVHTAKQSMSVSAKSLVAGHTYSLKNGDDLYVYLGYHHWWDWGREYYNRTNDLIYQRKNKGKKHLFAKLGTLNVEPMGPNRFAAEVDSEISSEYAAMYDKFAKGVHVSNITNNIFADSKLVVNPAEVKYDVQTPHSPKIVLIKKINDRMCISITLYQRINVYINGKHTEQQSHQCCPGRIFDSSDARLHRIDSNNGGNKVGTTVITTIARFDVPGRYYSTNYSDSITKPLINDSSISVDILNEFETIRKRLWEELVKPITDSDKSYTTINHMNNVRIDAKSVFVPLVDAVTIMFEEGWLVGTGLVHDNEYCDTHWIDGY